MEKDNDSPSEYIKAAGFKSVWEISAMTGLHYNTLLNWHASRPKAFKVLIAGCVALRDQEQPKQGASSGKKKAQA